MRNRFILISWLLYMGLALQILLVKTDVTSDLTFFLPRGGDPDSQLVLKASREGPGSRMLLVGLQGGTDSDQFSVIDQLIERLDQDPVFERVIGGLDPETFIQLEERLFPYRFHLGSPREADHWNVNLIKAALTERMQELHSSQGRLTERWLTQDPLGHWKRYLEQLMRPPGPEIKAGRWISRTPPMALMLLETRAAGFDMEAQQSAQNRVQAAFEAIPHEGLELIMGGAGVLAVEANRSITAEAVWLSSINTFMVSSLLLWVYRSWRVLVLGLIPLLSGIITGALAIRLGFGSIHAITLGFGSTLLGVAADYPNHFFTHVHGHHSPESTMRRLWPTLRLGILTNMIGFGVMIFSGFKGLQEIGIFAALGLLGAGLSTRWVIPALTPQRDALGPWIETMSRNPLTAIPFRIRMAFCLIIPFAISMLFVGTAHPLFNDDIATLNPIKPDRLAADLSLQRAFNVPDMRHMIVVRGENQEEVLQNAESLSPLLEELQHQGSIEGFELVSDILPSIAFQNERIAALPSTAVARRLLDNALLATSFRADAFQPFLDGIESARSLPPLSERDFTGTILEPRIMSLLQADSKGIAAFIPLYGIHDADAIARIIVEHPQYHAQFMDLRNAMTAQIKSNRVEAGYLLILGLVITLGALLLGLRDLKVVIRTLGPMILATLSTGLCAAMLADGLNIYHLASLLLVMGLSLDQALFFNRKCPDAHERSRTHLSILICSLSSIFAFGGLAFSEVSVLKDIGSTVALGAFLAIGFAALLANPPTDSR